MQRMSEGTEVLVVDAPTVRRLLPMTRCIDVMEAALAGLAREEAVNPLRSILGLPYTNSWLAVMPGAQTNPPTFGVKVISIFNENRSAGYETHQGLVLLFESEHGTPVAMVDASEVTALRTAAVSGVATRALARPDADDLAILGSGTQARTHLEAMLAVRPVRRVRAWSPTRERLDAFVADARSHHDLPIEAASGPEQAVDGASLICTVSGATEPVVHSAQVANGAHVNAVGSALPTARELDADTIRRSRLYVDRRESALSESGDILLAIRDGAIDEGHIVSELGEVLIGSAQGRTSPEDVTVFKSLGLAVEDVAAAQAVVEAARSEGAGVSVRLG
jgi:ornithine cyclodeaminase/alanine dehydrogenase-like protein (mu-crystallin family)